MNLKNNLQNKYIAYLDVLGFKELVYNKKIEKLDNYFNTISEVLDEIKLTKGNIESLLISDSTILIAPNTEEDFKILIRAIQTIQSRLLMKDVWLRGAISFGEVFFDKSANLVVGKGLVKAYLLENQAIYPRVILDSSIIPKIGNNRKEFLQYLNSYDSNPSSHGDLQLIFHDYNNSNETSTSVIEDDFFVSYGHKLLKGSFEKNNIENISNLLSKNLYSNHSHHKKYLWVKNYMTKVAIQLRDTYNLKGDPERSGYYSKCYLKFEPI